MIYNMADHKILIVDDEPLNIILYTKMLENQNFQITTASNGKECLIKTLEINPDLIILDWNMPVLNGIETLQSLKKKAITSSIPVLMITGVMTSSQDLALALSTGAIDFLKKPFDGLELISRIKNILFLTETMNTLAKQNNYIEDKNIFITSLLESIPHPVAYYLTSGVLNMCNAFFETVLNTNKSNLLGKSIYANFNEPEKEFHMDVDRKLISTGGSISYERIAFADDKPYIISKNVIIDIHGKSIGIISIFIDISELKKANEEIINTKKIELISSTIKLIHLTNWSASLLQDLDNILPFSNVQGQDLIRQMKQKFELNMREQIWNDFESRFENAFDSFYNILLERFPTLTSNERKLCALIRSGLSSKEISILTFQNSHSVDIARYRLRKKLGLSNDDNLMDFLIRADR